MPSAELPFQVLYEDNHLLAVSKPALLATMGVADDRDSLLSIAKEYLKRKYQKPGNVYLGIVSRNSILARYALWHLSEIARASMDPALERQYITRLLAEFPSSTLWRKAHERMIDNQFESGDYRATPRKRRTSHRRTIAPIVATIRL